MKYFALILLLFSFKGYTQKDSALNPKSRTRNLDRGVLVRLEDAEPTMIHKTFIEQVYRSEIESDGVRQLFETNISHGLTETLEVRSSLPLVSESGNRRGSRDMTLGLVKNFLEGKSGKHPGLALAAGLRLPTGQGSRGIGSSVSFLLTQSLGKEEHRHRFHLNLTLKDNSHPQSGEAALGHEVVVGYDTALSPSTALVVSVGRELEVYEDKFTNMIEMATKTDIGGKSSVGIAVGKGIDENSPDLRSTVSYTLSL